MRNKTFLMFGLTGTMLLACQKENSLNPSTNPDIDPFAERYASLSRPLTVEENGVKTLFTYDADGRLIAKENLIEKVYVKRDVMNRVAEIDITRRTPYATRGGLEMEQKLRILYGYGQENHYPAKAAVLQSYPGRSEMPIQNITFEFDKRGGKLRETIQDLEENTTTRTDYVYDALNRLTMTTTTCGLEIIKSVKSTQFMKGFGVYTLVKELALLPGTVVQAGLPDETEVRDRKSYYTIHYNYEVNNLQQPVFIKEWDSNGVMSTTTITYR